MILNRTLQLSFLASITIHLIIVLQGFTFNAIITKKSPKKIEISYIKNSSKEVRKDIKLGSAKKEPLLDMNAKVGLDKRIPPPFIGKEENLRPIKQSVRQDFVFSKPDLIKPEAIVIKRKVSLPAIIDMAKIDNPSYVSYYQLVREKIRRAAYQNYSSNETGEAYVTFIISSEGYLKDVRLVDEKSSASSYLRQIALDSVANAAPFPKFPKELDYPRLTFNVVISFEIE
jgi:TonB family protein